MPYIIEETRVFIRALSVFEYEIWVSVDFHSTQDLEESQCPSGLMFVESSQSLFFSVRPLTRSLSAHRAFFVG